jgi:nucleotide-binding universal stress UspA family protein
LFSKILVAIDGSEPSLKALKHAIQLATILKSQIHVISVVDELKLPFAAQHGLWAKVSHEELFRSMLEKMNKEITRIIEDRPNLKIDADLVEGKPAKKIVDFAEKEQFDLIVIGAKGYGMIEGLVVGSVSNNVVNTATKPVLIVK